MAKTQNTISLIIPTKIKSGFDSLGWQIVCGEIEANTPFSPQVLFFEEETLIDLDGNVFKDDLQAALISLTYEADIFNVYKIKEKYPKAVFFAGGFPTTNNPLLFSALAKGVFLGEFDGLKKSSFLEITESIVKQEKPKHFISPTDEKPDSIVCLLEKDVSIAPSSRYFNEIHSHFGVPVVETGRGCPFNCRFCEIPKSRKERHFSRLSIEKAIKETKSERIALVSAALASHPNFREIVENSLKEGYSLSFSSMRADILSFEEIKLLAKAGVKTITLAPETSSQTLKKYIRKNISTEKMIETSSMAFEAGIKRLKLYYIIGIPDETKDDVYNIAEEISAIVTKAKKHAKERKWMPIIDLSVNPYIIKKETEGEFISEKEYTAKLKLLRKTVAGIGGVSVRFHDYYEGACEGMLSYTNEKINDIIEKEKLYRLSYRRIVKALLPHYRNTPYKK